MMRALWRLLVENWRRRRTERREDPCLPGVAGYTFLRRVEVNWDVPKPPRWRRLDMN
jgi:hypothetical protein